MKPIDKHGNNLAGLLLTLAIWSGVIFLVSLALTGGF